MYRAISQSIQESCVIKTSWKRVAQRNISLLQYDVELGEKQDKNCYNSVEGRFGWWLCCAKLQIHDRKRNHRRW